MKATIYLRIASVLTLVHAILHTVGGVFGKPLPGPATVAVEAMQSNQFMWLGHMRTYFGFYRGMGLALTISLTIDAVAFWTLASLVKQDGRRLRPVLAVFLAGYLIMSVNSYTYFFSGPVIAEILIAACVGMAMATAKETAESRTHAASGTALSAG
jgi:hypothetical protein